jgi:hypothetical protein
LFVGKDGGAGGYIATAIYETFKIQTEIDNVYPEILTDLIEKK